jgi:hypothetical protein
MRLYYTDRFSRSYEDAPARVQRQCAKQLAFLAQDLRHPSLRAKKYDEARDISQGHVNAEWRFYFKIEGDRCYLLDIIPHPK